MDDLFDQVEAARKWQLQQALEWQAEEIRNVFTSASAQGSAKTINQMFASRGLKDKNGDLVRVGSPSEIAEAVRIVGDTIVIALTEDQDRWIRADGLYGKNLLKDLGIKYSLNDADS